MMASVWQPTLLGLGAVIAKETNHAARRQRVETLFGRRAEFGYCDHWDCGGYRRVVTFKKSAKVCERHWRQRRRIVAVLHAVAERGRA